MANQQILLTAMPRAITRGGPTLPVSVYVSPRLMGDAAQGESVLGAFPDWLDWTGTVAQQGLQLTLRAAGGDVTVPVDVSVLEPRLWRAMFNDRTYVRSHVFADHSQAPILSWPMRFALSTIKSVYQQAGVELALPDRSPQGDPREQQRSSPRRVMLRELLRGLSMDWNPDEAERLRNRQREMFGARSAPFPMRVSQEQLSPDGLLLPDSEVLNDEQRRAEMVEQFAVVSHMPLGAPIAENPPDFDTLLDFHQALSALNSYPELMRALGLVFDLDLPADIFELGIAQTGTVSVVDLPGWQWQLAATEAPPSSRPLETSYAYAHNARDESSLFATAPRGVVMGSNDLDTLGLLNIGPTRFGLAQVDIDGAMHKTLMLGDVWLAGRGDPLLPQFREVYDETTALPALRSGGFSLFADGRALSLLRRLKDNKDFDDAMAGVIPARPFVAEDLVHGYRIDIWDSRTDDWHSLHRRDAQFLIGDEGYAVAGREGFTQLAATQAAPNPADPPQDDLYLHEAVARWAGWSLSAPPPGRALSSDADPANALTAQAQHAPATPFPMTTQFSVVRNSLPALRVGRTYRWRVRVVDLCGNSLELGDPLTDSLSRGVFTLPADGGGTPYLRYEPVGAPIVAVRDVAAITGPGSTLTRLVIRTFNTDPSLDAAAADVTAADRHLLPPRISVDAAEKLSMFDDPSGALIGTPAMWQLIGERDAGQLTMGSVEYNGRSETFPLEASETVATLPYLPDVLSRGVALRDLPGAGEGTLLRLADPASPGSPLDVTVLADPHPRPGSATLIDFPAGPPIGPADPQGWQSIAGIRLQLREAVAGDEAPVWSGAARSLSVALPKAAEFVVPLSSFVNPADLRLMGVWQWIREHIEARAAGAGAPPLLGALDADLIAHVLQRAAEGGHWMLTPPTLLRLVHAVQQPIGSPRFVSIAAQHQPYGNPALPPYDETRDPAADVLQTMPEGGPTAASELATITAWRKPGSVDAVLLGGLAVHAASTERVDITAHWTDPIDDPSVRRVAADSNTVENQASVDEIPLRIADEGYLENSGREVGYFDADHEYICFVRSGDSLGNLRSADPEYLRVIGRDAAPRHHFGDTKHHRVSYIATATSRFRDCFAADAPGGFTRPSAPIVVDVPASERPQPPQLSYVVPSFGWQRQRDTNITRSVRFGGGLRVFLERGWFSSGADELLGITLYALDPANPTWDYDTWKSSVTQWGSDPIWRSAPMPMITPGIGDFVGAAASEENVSLPGTPRRRVGVVGYPVQFDEDRQLWFADVTVDSDSLAYTPFIRLALARYQPYALPEAKLSRVVLADFAQLVPGRSAVATADPYRPRALRVSVSGVAPTGPAPAISGWQPTNPVGTPTRVEVGVQRRRDDITGDLAWEDAGTEVAQVLPETDPARIPATPLLRWFGSVRFAADPEPGRYRLVIREFEYLSATYTEQELDEAGNTEYLNPRRLIYAETVEVDSALLG